MRLRLRLGRCCVELHYGIVYLVFFYCAVAQETGSKIVRKRVPQCNFTHHRPSLPARLQNGRRSFTLLRKQERAHRERIAVNKFATRNFLSYYRPCSRFVSTVSWNSGHCFSIRMPSMTTAITGKVSYLNRHELVNWISYECMSQKFEAQHPEEGIYVNSTRGWTPPPQPDKQKGKKFIPKTSLTSFNLVNLISHVYKY